MGIGQGWAHRLALVTSLATLALIVAGGLVTNTGAALAVPDWPTTFGQNMFLYPWSRMVGGILIEHSHRLLGAMVGLLTVGLAVTVWVTDRRAWLRTLAALAVAVVCLQGVLGGLRVVLLRDALAVVHGCLAQAFFILTVALAGFTTPPWRAPGAALEPSEARGLFRLAAGVASVLYGQVVLGALVTHEGWVGTHLAGAVLVTVGVAALVAGVLASPGGGPALRRRAWAISLLMVVQVALGFGAYVVRFTGLALPGGEVLVVGLPVTHRAVGALLLGATVSVALHAWRRQVVADVGAPVETRVVAGRVSA